MSDKEKIYSLDLMYNDLPMPFVIKKLEGIDRIALGIEANPHRHNYYSIIWPLSRRQASILLISGNTRYVTDHIFFVSPNQVHQVIITSRLHRLCYTFYI